MTSTLIPLVGAMLLSGCSVIKETDDEVVDIMWCVGACVHASKQTEVQRKESTSEPVE